MKLQHIIMEELKQEPKFIISPKHIFVQTLILVYSEPKYSISVKLGTLCKMM